MGDIPVACVRTRRSVPTFHWDPILLMDTLPYRGGLGGGSTILF